MSFGGVFNLIANDGMADRMVMATHLLNLRMDEIMQWRGRDHTREKPPTTMHASCSERQKIPARVQSK